MAARWVLRTVSTMVVESVGPKVDMMGEQSVGEWVEHLVVD